MHEICHMWFGNLATMRWWNDLWLNEAFATCLSYKCNEKGGPCTDEFIEDTWLDFQDIKAWGLSDDAYPTTHMVAATCSNTDTAESLIDGVTYGKGSSVIKQLMFAMGWKAFITGIR